MARKTLTFALLALLVLTAHFNTVAGQAGTTPSGRFDWVKTYSGLEYQSEPTNKIVHMEHDSQGNIYILGLFGVGATINGTSLLPMAPYGPNNTTVNTVIAKLSPSGELLWHKALHSNNGVHNIARDMHIIGDSALMCLIDLRQPASGSNYLYYLDTLLLQDDNHHLFPLDSVCNGTATAFITFDRDGNVIEQHFLQRAYITNSGELITQRYHMHGPNGTTGALTAYTSTLSSPSFDVDNEGNIILSRCPVDMDMCRDTAGQDREEYSVWNGKIAAIRIYIDGARHLTYYPEERPQRWNITLLKFSPHFEELLSVRQLIQSDSSHTLTTSGNNRPTSIIHDEENNIYVTGYLEANTADFKVCGLADTLYCNNMLGWYGFLIKYDSDLNPIFAQHIRNANRNYTSWISYFCNSKIVDSSLFVSMTAYRWSQGELDENLNNSHLYIDDTLLDFNYNTGFLRLNKVSGAMQSYGKAITSQRTELGNPAARCDIAASANRVFSQIYYINDLHLQDTTISSNGFDRHYGTMVWDYDGHPLQFIDYSATNPNNEIGNLILFDSTLYIGGMLYGAAQFDTIPISCQRSTALIAKYIDTSFMTPYVPRDTTHTDPIDTGSVRITVVGDEGAFVAYPNPFRQKVTIEVQGGEPLAETAWLTDLTGRRQQVRLIPQGHSSNNTFTQSHNQIYTLDLTSRPQSTYLLTLTTADGHQHTVRLLKQSDIFGQ